MDQHNSPEARPNAGALVTGGTVPSDPPPEPAPWSPEALDDAGLAPAPARNFVTRSLNLIDTQWTGRLVAPIVEKAGQLAPGPVVLTYVAVIAMAEMLGAWGAVIPGAIYHAALVPILLTHYVLAEQSRYRRILPVLALFPLLRILSWTMPIRQVPYIFWYALVGIPLLVGVAFTIRLLGLSTREIGLSLPSWPRQVFIASLGVPLSALAFLLVRPSPLAVAPGWQDFVVGAGILLIATGFTEELLFRGLLQPVAVSILGRVGILCTIALFTIMYLGAVSWGYTLFMGSVGWLFGWCVGRTHSIAGVTIAHGLLNIGLLLVWPRLAFAPPVEPLLLSLSLGLLALWLLIALPLRVLPAHVPAQATAAGHAMPGPGIAAAGQESDLAAVPGRMSLRGWRRLMLAVVLSVAVVLLLLLAAFQTLGIGLPSLPSLGSAGPARSPAPTGTALTVASPTSPSVALSPTITALAGRLQVITLPQTNFSGGFTNPDTLYRSAPARLVFGQDTTFSEVRATFVANTPAGRAIRQARLVLHGVDSEDDAKTPIRIVLNGTQIYQGPDPLPNDYTTQTGPRNWGLFTWEIPPGVVRPGTNTLTITNLDASPAPRFLAFDYALIAWLEV